MCFTTQLKRKSASNYTTQDKIVNQQDETTNQQQRQQKNFQENELHNYNLNKRTQLEGKLASNYTKEMINEQSKTNTN